MLPHELDFQVHSLWTPAKELKRQNNQSAAGFEVLKKRNSSYGFKKVSEINVRRSRSPQVIDLDSTIEVSWFL